MLIAVTSTPATDVSSRFGRRLRTIRLEHGMTQADCARYLGIDRSHISQVELGKSAVSLKLIAVIAQGFDLDLHTLMDGI